MPTKAAAQEVPKNSRILVLLTGTPTLRAAMGSPPEANIQLPNVVRVRIQVPRMVTPMNQSSAVW